MHLNKFEWRKDEIERENLYYTVMIYMYIHVAPYLQFYNLVVNKYELTLQFGFCEHRAVERRIPWRVCKLRVINWKNMNLTNIISSSVCQLPIIKGCKIAI